MSVAHAHSHSEPQKTFLKDYTPPSHFIDTTNLTFDIQTAKRVIVTSKLVLRANPAAKTEPGVLELDGNPNLELLAVTLNGQVLDSARYERRDDKLVFENLPTEGEITLEITIAVNPEANTTLNGLYVSGGKFTTQCESQGFRNITFFLDRPDVMSVYTTKIIGDKAVLPQMLSNGNEVDSGKTENGRDYVVWHDPSKKPSYLFALVAGNLDLLQDSFVTKSGRHVDLRVYVDKGQRDKSYHAMQALKDSMKWEEEKYGLEYDLDNYMIVAVDDFNFGAMENKGLNIFNSSAVLADPQTATDTRYNRIRQIVGHEYFHNWSGNRVTVRDWFQISLKEGFTNFRDQSFNADMGNKDVARIDDVATLRATQFPEDAGPMAHPIRPNSFVTIENFYTTTVYEKGAEVIGMMKTILGDDGFRKGTDLYFSRNDGKAVTTEDFVQALSDANGVDLSQFESTWYNQAGTPELKVRDAYDEAKKEYTLTFEQTTRPTPGQPNKKPFHIPVRIGLLDDVGNDIPLQVKDDSSNLVTNGDVLNITQAKQTVVFKDVDKKPLPSLLRGFSAPVKIDYPYTRENLIFMLSHDIDRFNRWEAAQNLGVSIIKEQVEAAKNAKQIPVAPEVINAYMTVLKDQSIDKEVKALLLALPSETYLGELYPAGSVDVQAIHNARDKVRKAIANALEPEFKLAFNQNQASNLRPYAFIQADVAERALRNLSLSYLLVSDHAERYLANAEAQYKLQHNMTDVAAAFSLLVNRGSVELRDAIVEDFYRRWKDDSLVMNQWFSTQATADRPDTLDRVKALVKHPAYNRENPNKVRALIGGFGANLPWFHAADGSGYRFLADQVLDIDTYNPQLAAKIVGPLTSLHKFGPESRKLMKLELERIAKHNISKNLSEVVSSTLKMTAQ